MPYDINHLNWSWDPETGIVVVTNYPLGRDPDGTINGMHVRAYGSYDTPRKADAFVRRTWNIVREGRVPSSNVLYLCEYKVKGFK